MGVMDRIKDAVQGNYRPKQETPRSTDGEVARQDKETPPAGKDAGTARGRAIEEALRKAED